MKIPERSSSVGDKDINLHLVIFCCYISLFLGTVHHKENGRLCVYPLSVTLTFAFCSPNTQACLHRHTQRLPPPCLAEASPSPWHKTLCGANWHCATSSEHEPELLWNKSIHECMASLTKSVYRIFCRIKVIHQLKQTRLSEIFIP